MSRPQQSPSFIVSQPLPVAPRATKPGRDAAPLLSVPASLVIDDVALEPHWLDAIDSATD